MPRQRKKIASFLLLSALSCLSASSIKMDHLPDSWYASDALTLLKNTDRDYQYVLAAAASKKTFRQVNPVDVFKAAKEIQNYAMGKPNKVTPFKIGNKKGLLLCDSENFACHILKQGDQDIVHYTRKTLRNYMAWYADAEDEKTIEEVSKLIHQKVRLSKETVKEIVEAIRNYNPGAKAAPFLEPYIQKNSDEELYRLYCYCIVGDITLKVYSPETIPWAEWYNKIKPYVSAQTALDLARELHDVQIQYALSFLQVFPAKFFKEHKEVKAYFIELVKEIREKKGIKEARIAVQELAQKTKDPDLLILYYGYFLQSKIEESKQGSKPKWNKIFNTMQKLPEEVALALAEIVYSQLGSEYAAFFLYKYAIQDSNENSYDKFMEYASEAYPDSELTKKLNLPDFSKWTFKKIRAYFKMAKARLRKIKKSNPAFAYYAKQKLESKKEEMYEEAKEAACGSLNKKILIRAKLEDIENNYDLDDYKEYNNFVGRVYVSWPPVKKVYKVHGFKCEYKVPGEDFHPFVFDAASVTALQLQIRLHKIAIYVEYSITDGELSDDPEGISWKELD